MAEDNEFHVHHYREMYEHSRNMFDMNDIMKKAGIIQGIKVAELGCGPGAFTIPIAESVSKNGMVFAVDKNSEALEMLRERLKEKNLEGVVKTLQEPMESTSIQDHSVDVIFLANVFHDITNHQLFFREARRILKKGGKLVDLDWKKTGSGFGPPFSIRLNPDEARAIFEKHGLTVIHEEDMQNDHYLLIVKPDNS